MPIHPFIEGYLWKALDEKIFEHEKIYLPSGEKNVLICIEFRIPALSAVG